MTSMMPTILIIESNTIFRQVLRDVIARRFPELRIEEAGTAEEGLQKAIQQHPRLVLTDLYLEGDRGFSMIDTIATKQPEAHIAVLTDRDEEEYRKAAMAHGAEYFVSKTGPNSQKVLSIIKNRLLD
jgi:DNA-binding NarL/FixJ family response regulator